ncbi:hypothetical protein [Bradyrhizobium sp. Rc3b]|uniref:hypothetical protein n=1 Tax=Bradyrhizobium sp. Rc3b TaxID=1855322 RepID=UPI000B821993|nr:hypothetical protein [Bradyrhizobium sp. Rc3b]
MSDRNIGIAFLDQLAREVIASPLIWNCLTSKHPAYQHEQETRLAIMGTPDHLAAHVLARFRRSEIVPYIADPLPVREPHKVAEIVLGPAAPLDTKGRWTMLRSTGIGGSPRRWSSISSSMNPMDFGEQNAGSVTRALASL